MRWTYKSNIQGVALTDGDNFKKGDTIPVQVYEYYMDSRGGGSSTKTQYYYGRSPKPEEAPELPPSYSPPRATRLDLGKTFEFKKETPLSVSTPENKNKKYLIWLLVAVGGYFAYKKFKK
tara:strand:- start:132 stop:491 length:360 start_codon:yes stop_codon:yes gene_type:complete